MTDYYTIDALSASGLVQLAPSPATFDEWRRNGREKTDAMRFGSAHHAVRDGTFSDRFVVRPEEIDGKGEGGRKRLAAWKEEQAARGSEIVTAKELESLRLMSASIDPLVVDLERGCRREVELFWKRDGVDCKAKIDVISPMAVVLDYKAVDDASPRGFQKSIDRYRMHYQAAWYLEACAANGIDARVFAWVACEKAPPYLPALYQAREESLTLARSEIDVLVARYRRCREANNWPGYQTRPQLIGVSRWYQPITTEGA